MKVKILGSGGYFPTADRHTACYLVDDKILLDAGTGVLRLKKGMIGETLHILLSHIHQDHSIGLAYLYGRRQELGCRFKVYCSEEEQQFLETNFFNSRMFDPEASSFLEFEEIREEMTIAGEKIRCIPQVHGKFGSRGFIIGKEVAYLTDTKIREEKIPKVHLLLHEAYSLREDDDSHSSVVSVANLAMKSGVSELGFIHINPNFTDSDLIEMLTLSPGIKRFIASDEWRVDL